MRKVIVVIAILCACCVAMAGDGGIKFIGTWYSKPSKVVRIIITHDSECYWMRRYDKANGNYVNGT